MREATLSDYKQRILRVMLHVQQHPDELLDLKRLAGVAAFSPFHFHRIFRGLVGRGTSFIGVCHDDPEVTPIARAGHALRPLPCLEVYLNSPESTDPEDLVTDIYLPLEG